MLDFFVFGEMILQNISGLGKFLLEPPSPLLRDPLIGIKTVIEPLAEAFPYSIFDLFNQFITLYVEYPLGVSIVTIGFTTFITFKFFKLIWDTLPVL